jgi:hypothetical protein
MGPDQQNTLGVVDRYVRKIDYLASRDLGFDSRKGG